MKTIKIKYLNCVPGMGGINYDYLSSKGWTPESSYPVMKENSRGVYVKFPWSEYSTFLYWCEVEEIN